jgi:hypothetical protein
MRLTTGCHAAREASESTRGGAKPSQTLGSAAAGSVVKAIPDDETAVVAISFHGSHDESGGKSSSRLR